MIWTKDLKLQKCSFDKKFEIETKVERIKQINGNIYVYIFNDTIKVYDYKTFKLKADLKLPFKRKEPIFNILDNEVLIYMASGKLYFYKINISENKLEFMHYLSNIYSFHYLSKRKEILLLTEPCCPYPDLYIQYGMAKSDLMGNIILTNKITPKINHEFVSPEEKNDFLLSQSSDFSVFYGLLNDEFIINIIGYYYEYDDGFDYGCNFIICEVDSRITIYKADDFELKLDESHPKYLNYMKFGDNLFKFKEKEILFFYNEKENKIEYINNIFNYLNNITDDQLNKKYEDKFKEGERYYLHYGIDKTNYFYLSDKLFAFFDNDNNIYIVDISNENKVVRKIDASWNEYYIKFISYKISEDKKENLYICFGNKRKKLVLKEGRMDGEEREGKIIHGIIG